MATTGFTVDQVFLTLTLAYILLPALMVVLSLLLRPGSTGSSTSSSACCTRSASSCRASASGGSTTSSRSSYWRQSPGPHGTGHHHRSHAQSRPAPGRAHPHRNPGFSWSRRTVRTRPPASRRTAGRRTRPVRIDSGPALHSRSRSSPAARWARIGRGCWRANRTTASGCARRLSHHTVDRAAGFPEGVHEPRLRHFRCSGCCIPAQLHTRAGGIVLTLQCQPFHEGCRCLLT
jgi:hypothetical protein